MGHLLDPAGWALLAAGPAPEMFDSEWLSLSEWHAAVSEGVRWLQDVSLQTRVVVVTPWMTGVLFLAVMSLWGAYTALRGLVRGLRRVVRRTSAAPRNDEHSAELLGILVAAGWPEEDARRLLRGRRGRGERAPEKARDIHNDSSPPVPASADLPAAVAADSRPPAPSRPEEAHCRRGHRQMKAQHSPAGGDERQSRERIREHVRQAAARAARAGNTGQQRMLLGRLAAKEAGWRVKDTLRGRGA